MHLAGINDFATYLKQFNPFIGNLTLDKVHAGTLLHYIDARKKAGVRNKTINLTLATVRRILNLALRLWRDENEMTWLAPPLIQLLPIHDARKPYPLIWEEQSQLFQALPDHLAWMCLFKVNIGCREQEVCQLRWDWEVEVPELDTSVFIIPDTFVKNREDKLVVLNRITLSVVNELRKVHPKFVFTYKNKPVTSINNSIWKRARSKVGMK